MVLEDLLASDGNLLLEHLLVVSQKELKPVAFSVVLDLDLQGVVNSLVLLFDEGNKVLGLVIKLELVYEGL